MLSAGLGLSLSLCLSLGLCLCLGLCQLLSVELAPRVARLAGGLLQHWRGGRAAMAAFMRGGCHMRAVMYELWPLLPPGLALGQVDAGQ